MRIGGAGHARRDFFLIFRLTIIYPNWHIIRYGGALSSAGFDVGNDVRVCVSRRDKVSDMLVLQTDEADAM